MYYYRNTISTYIYYYSFTATPCLGVAISFAIMGLAQNKLYPGTYRCHRLNRLVVSQE